MKGKLAAGAVLLAATAIIPIAVSKSSRAEHKSETSMADTAQNSQTTAATQDETEILCALTAAVYSEDYCDETLKAIAVVMNTNLAAGAEYSDDDCIYEADADNGLKSAYDEIRACVNDVKNTTLCQNGKALYVPYSESSNGFTYQSASYDYLRPVSSVWDCFSSDYDPETRCEGVSLAGLDYLCKNGESYESALKWYLPNFELTA